MSFGYRRKLDPKRRATCDAHMDELFSGKTCDSKKTERVMQILVNGGPPAENSAATPMAVKTARPRRTRRGHDPIPGNITFDELLAELDRA